MSPSILKWLYLRFRHVSIYHNLSRARTIKYQAPLCSVECYWNLITVTSRELLILIGAPTFRRTRTTSIDLSSVRDVALRTFGSGYETTPPPLINFWIRPLQLDARGTQVVTLFLFPLHVFNYVHPSLGHFRRADTVAL